MKKIPYFILDVFAKNKYEGNQLAVYLDLENVLNQEDMLNIAKEINFAETTFIKKKITSNKYEVKIFTTESEIPFAGHPTLGTAYILAKHLIKESSSELVLSLKKGNIPVQMDKPENLDASRFTMQQAQPEFGVVIDHKIVSEALNLPIDIFDISMPIQDVNTGLPYLIIFLENLKAIENVKLNYDLLKQFLIDSELHKTNNTRKLSSSLFFVTKETAISKNQYHTRMFVLDDYTIWEDAATGSANGCFLAYLLKHQRD